MVFGWWLVCCVRLFSACVWLGVVWLLGLCFCLFSFRVSGCLTCDLLFGGFVDCTLCAFLCYVACVLLGWFDGVGSSFSFSLVLLVIFVWFVACWVLLFCVV